MWRLLAEVSPPPCVQVEVELINRLLEPVSDCSLLVRMQQETIGETKQQKTISETIQQETIGKTIQQETIGENIQQETIGQSIQ